MGRKQNRIKGMNAMLLLKVASIAFLFIAWFASVRWTLVPYLTTPTDVVRVFLREYSQIGVHMAVSSLRALAGFLIGSLLGIVFALLMGYNPTFLAVVNPFILAIKPTPVLALIPIFILWFGLGEMAKILYIALGCFFILVVISSEAIKSVNRLYIWAGQALGYGKKGVYRRVILPAIVPGIIGGLRIALTTAFPLTIAAEFLGAKQGLGSYLIKAEVHLTISKMIAAVIAITVLVMVLDMLLRVVTVRITRWTERES